MRQWDRGSFGCKNVYSNSTCFFFIKWAIIFCNCCSQAELERTKQDAWLETVERTKPCPNPPPPSPAQDLLALACEASDVSSEDGEEVCVIPPTPSSSSATGQATATTPAPVAPVRPVPRLLDLQCPTISGASVVNVSRVSEDSDAALVDAVQGFDQVSFVFREK